MGTQVEVLGTDFHRTRFEYLKGIIKLSIHVILKNLITENFKM